jgi:hypothetical protein
MKANSKKKFCEEIERQAARSQPGNNENTRQLSSLTGQRPLSQVKIVLGRGSVPRIFPRILVNRETSSRREKQNFGPAFHPNLLPAPDSLFRS